MRTCQPPQPAHAQPGRSGARLQLPTALPSHGPCSVRPTLRPFDQPSLSCLLGGAQCWGWGYPSASSCPAIGWGGRGLQRHGAWQPQHYLPHKTSMAPGANRPQNFQYLPLKSNFLLHLANNACSLNGCQVTELSYSEKYWKTTGQNLLPCMGSEPCQDSWYRQCLSPPSVSKAKSRFLFHNIFTEAHSQIL